jgi:hypothetical protein
MFLCGPALGFWVTIVGDKVFCMTRAGEAKPAALRVSLFD